MIPRTLDLLKKDIRAFCERWKITEFALFGSALRSDLRPDSDIDVLVEFAPQASWGLLDHVDMKTELGSLLGREVDLVSKSALERSRNWIRREEILSTAETLVSDGGTQHVAG